METIAKIRLLYHVKKKTVGEVAREVRLSRNTVYTQGKHYRKKRQPCQWMSGATMHNAPKTINSVATISALPRCSLRIR